MGYGLKEEEEVERGRRREVEGEGGERRGRWREVEGGGAGRSSRNNTFVKAPLISLLSFLILHLSPIYKNKNLLLILNNINSICRIHLRSLRRMRCKGGTSSINSPNPSMGIEHAQIVF